MKYQTDKEKNLVYQDVGLPASLGDKILINIQDKTPFDPLIIIYDIHGNIISQTNNHSWVRYKNSLLCATTQNGEYYLCLIEQNAQIKY